MNKENKLIKFVLFLIITLLLFTNKIYAANNNDKLLLIDNVDILKYKNNHWYKVSTFDTESYFLVYVDNKYFGMYKIKVSDEYTLYDNQNITKTYDGELFAYTNNFNIKNKSIIIDKISDENVNEINSILGLTLKNDDFSINEQVKIDLDNNGIEDEIVNVSNLDALEEQARYFNLIYVKLNNENRQILINQDVKESEVLTAPIYRIKYIFSFDNSLDNIVFEEGFFSNVNDTNNIIFENKDGNYNKINIEKEKNKNNKKEEQSKYNNYSIYIFAGIACLLVLVGYIIFNNIKKKEDVMDD